MNRHSLWTIAVATLLVCSSACRQKQAQNVVPPVDPIIKVPGAFVFRGEPGVRAITPTESGSLLNYARAHQSDPKTLSDAACALLESGNPQQAVNLLERAQAAAPRDPEIAYNLARALYRQGKPEEALKQADRAVQQRPTFDEARLLGAGIDAEQGRPDSAEQRLRKLLNAVSVIARVIQGVVELKRGHVPQGLAIFQSLLSANPNDPLLEYNTGVAQQLSQNLPAAEKLYRGALANDPNLAEAHYNLGTLLASTGQPAAQDEFRSAVKLKPELGSTLAKSPPLKIKPDDQTAVAEMVRSIQLFVTQLFHGKQAMTVQEATKAGKVETVFVSTGTGSADQVF